MPPSLENSARVVPAGGTVDETCDASNNNHFLGVLVTRLGPHGNQVAAGSRLLIPDVSSSNAGIYTCRFRSNVGVTKEDTLTLQVVCKLQEEIL